MLAPKITALKPEPPHTLVVTFETGEVRLFDLTPHLEWGVFQKLRPYELFRGCFGFYLGAAHAVFWPIKARLLGP